MTRSTMINQTAWLCLSLFLLTVVCSFSGCKRSKHALSDVTGTVTINGEPASGAGVRFSPATGERTSTGQTDENGKYRLIFSPDFLGAIIGKHSVLVQYKGRLLTKEVEVENSSSVTIDLELSEFAPGK